jgi:acyl carrier protein
MADINPKDVERIVREVLTMELGVEPQVVVPEAKIVDDLGADSMDMVEITLALEERCGIDIPVQDEHKLMTVGQVVEYLKERLKQ